MRGGGGSAPPPLQTFVPRKGIGEAVLLTPSSDIFYSATPLAASMGGYFVFRVKACPTSLRTASRGKPQFFSPRLG